MKRESPSRAGGAARDRRCSPPRSTPIPAPSIDWFAIAPEIALFAAALVIVLGRSLIRHDPRVHDASLLTAIAGVAASGVFTGVQWTFVHGTATARTRRSRGMVAVDGFAVFVQDGHPRRDVARVCCSRPAT